MLWNIHCVKLDKILFLLDVFHLILRHLHGNVVFWIGDDAKPISCYLLFCSLENCHPFLVNHARSVRV